MKLFYLLKNCHLEEVARLVAKCVFYCDKKILLECTIIDIF